MRISIESAWPSGGRPPLALASVLGAAFGCVLVLACVALSAGSLLAFFSLGGLVIVVGGVIAVAFMSFDPGDVRAAVGAVAAVVRQPAATHDDLYGDMRAIMTWARIIKAKGMRELECTVSADELGDPFIRYGLNMILAGYSPEDVRAMLTAAADAHHGRDSRPVEVLHAMTSNAPAFGMVGTLVGMIAMLCSIDGDVSNIGATLAVAFLSTLYGLISARMVYMPAAVRLSQEVENRAFRHELVTEGIVLLAANKSPTEIQDRLNGYLPPDSRDYLNSLANGRSALVAAAPVAAPADSPAAGLPAHRLPGVFAPRRLKMAGL
jgi:chemotaxis protein MotA